MKLRRIYMLDHHNTTVDDVEIYLMLTLHTHDAMELREVVDIHYMDDIHKDTENMVKNVKVEELSEARC